MVVDQVAVAEPAVDEGAVDELVADEVLLVCGVDTGALVGVFLAGVLPTGVVGANVMVVEDVAAGLLSHRSIE